MGKQICDKKHLVKYFIISGSFNSRLVIYYQFGMSCGVGGGGFRGSVIV